MFKCSLFVLVLFAFCCDKDMPHYSWLMTFLCDSNQIQQLPSVHVAVPATIRLSPSEKQPCADGLHPATQESLRVSDVFLLQLSP